MNYRYSRFSRKTGGDEGESSFFCLFRASAAESWMPMPNGRNHYMNSFFFKNPDLRKTPPEILAKSTYFKAVTAHIICEDTTIQNPAKVIDLLSLSDEVYRDSLINIHWYLTSSTEWSGLATENNQVELPPPSPVEIEEPVIVPSVPTSGSSLPTTNYDYDLGSFVAVWPEEAEGRIAF